MKYIDNRLNANIIKLEDTNNNYASENVEGALEEINSKISSIEENKGMTSEQTQQLSAAYEHSQSTHAPSDAEANVQVDWNETNTTSDAYIKNKPTNLATTDDIPTVPTNISAFTNDANYASEAFVANKIAEASLSGDEVDLSGYVTKETGNANQITFADGQTFQAKLDAGILKGDKGDRGEQGPQGIQGPKGDPGSGGGSSINDTTASATTTYSSNKIETIKEGLNSQIDQKANQSDLEVQKQRIDGFTTLASGSTTGDAELIDGRIGADGVTYSNIGDTCSLIAFPVLE